MSHLFTELSTTAGQKAFDKRISNWIRAGRFDEANSWLAQRLKQIHPDTARLCLDFSAEDISIAYWSDLNLHALSIQRKPITAIGIDLSSYVIAYNDLGLKKPVLEISYYSDASYPFSTSTRTEILQSCEEYGTDWQGGFEDINAILEIEGIANIFDHLDKMPVRDYPIRNRSSELNDETALKAFVEFKLVDWWLQLQFHKKMTNEILSQEFFAKIPVIVGCHGFGPWLNTVTYTKKIGTGFEAHVQSNRSRRSSRQSDQSSNFSPELEIDGKIILIGIAGLAVQALRKYLK